MLPPNRKPGGSYPEYNPKGDAWNGMTGSQESGSVSNAVMQSKPSGGSNPYAEALNHMTAYSEIRRRRPAPTEIRRRRPAPTDSNARTGSLYGVPVQLAPTPPGAYRPPTQPTPAPQSSTYYAGAGQPGQAIPIDPLTNRPIAGGPVANPIAPPPNPGGAPPVGDFNPPSGGLTNPGAARPPIGMPAPQLPPTMFTPPVTAASQSATVAPLPRTPTYGGNGEWRDPQVIDGINPRPRETQPPPGVTPPPTTTPPPAGDVPPPATTPPPGMTPPPSRPTGEENGNYASTAVQWGQQTGYNWTPDDVRAYREWGMQNPGKHAMEWLLQTKGSAALGPQALNMAYDKIAERYRNNYQAEIDKRKPGWHLTGQHVKAYQDWQNANPDNQVHILDFLFGKQPTGTTPTSSDPNDPYKGVVWQNGRLIPQANANGGGGWFSPGNGAPGSGGGASGSSTSQSGPQGGYDPGDDYLKKLEAALRNQYGQAREDQMRQFRHESAITPGQGQNYGNFGSTMGDLLQRSFGAENSAISEAMLGTSEAERERKLRLALANIQSEASKYSADRGYDSSVGAASIGAGASRYSDDIRAMLGLKGIESDLYSTDVNRENNYFRNQQFYQQSVLDYLRLMQGVSPDAFIGNNQIPLGDILALLGGGRIG